MRVCSDGWQRFIGSSKGICGGGSVLRNRPRSAVAAAVYSVELSSCGLCSGGIPSVGSPTAKAARNKAQEPCHNRHDGPLLSLSGHHSIIHTLHRTQPQTTPMRATSAHKRPANPFQSGCFLRRCGIPRRDLAAIHPSRQHLGAFKHSLSVRLPYNLPTSTHGRNSHRYNLHPPRTMRHITNHAAAPRRLCNRPDRRVVQRTVHDLLQARRRVCRAPMLSQ